MVPTTRVATVLLVAMQAFGYSHAVVAADLTSRCEIADPEKILANISGDFELVADPQDSLGNLIFVANAVSGTSKIVVARIHRLTGKVVGNSLTTVADNYSGDSTINGPEFVQQPNGTLGLIYRGPKGVHAVFRSNPPSTWYDFDFNVNGARLAGSPPPISATKTGNYPSGGIPLGQKTYSENTASTKTAFYGPLGGGKLTEIAAILAAQGLQLSSSAQSPRDGYIFMSAGNSIANPGIYEAKINGKGGFVSGTLVNRVSASIVPLEALRAIRHPVTGSTVIFGAVLNQNKISIWEQPSSGGMLTLISTVTVAGTKTNHYRVENDASKVVLHYLIRDGSAKGSYTLPVRARGTNLVVGEAKKISEAAGGSELVWLPAANRWALFYRTATNGLTRCFVRP